jgi:hypothetical protein
MHLMQNEMDFVAGWSSSINITAGTAHKDDIPTRLNRVGPVLHVFKGKNGHGRSAETVQYIRCGACDTKGQWAALMSHNGIVRERVGEDGDERDLDNTIDNTNCLVTFGVSRGLGAVRASMTRHNGGSFVLSRRPTTMETEEFLKPEGEPTASQVDLQPAHVWWDEGCNAEDDSAWAGFRLLAVWQIGAG